MITVSDRPASNFNRERRAYYKAWRRNLILKMKHGRIRVFPRGPKSIFNEWKSYHSDSNMANSFYDTYGWFKKALTNTI